MLLVRSWFVIGSMVGVLVPTAHAEEGLWTLDQAVRPDILQRLGFRSDDGIVERVRSNVVRFSSGVAGALVSTRGLIITVRSAAAPCLYAASRTGPDHVRDGFWAGNGEDLRCPDLSVERLVSSKDVTDELRRGLGHGEEIPPKRVAALEKQCSADPGLECRVAALFDGGAMRLEEYRRYSDIRLVFAPEYRLAAFGPPSSRTIFPRYSLDVAFFRIYEQGKPLQSASPIIVHVAGPANNDRIVIASYPSETERYLPWVFLQPLASSVYRFEAQMAREQANALFALSRARSETTVQEAARARIERLAAELRSAMAVLQNQPIKRRQAVAETEWRSLVANPDPKEAVLAWAAATAAQSAYAKFYQRFLVVEGDRVRPFGELFDIGRHLVRLTQERQKPESERLPEYRGANLADIERKLSAPVSLSTVVERSLIGGGLQRILDTLSSKDPLAKALANEPPADRAARIVAETKLMDAAVRKRILATGALGDATDDPLVVLVSAVEADGRPLRQRYEHDVQRNLSTYLRALGERLSATDSAQNPRYSDASDDLRLSSGRISGFLDFGREVPAQTALAGLVTRAARARPGSPWELPARWLERQRQVDLAKQLNFALDADVGSGAPGGIVLNQKGQLVGVVIDSTLKSAVNRFLYRGCDDRAVAVHPAGIIEALRRIYDAGKLADEWVGGGG